MSYSILSISPFDKQLKRLIKKYPSLREEFLDLVDKLVQDPFQGKSLGNNCFKLRLSIKSKNKGKSGGARIITHLAVRDRKLYLLSIYDKAELQTISDKEIFDLLEFIE